LYFVEGKKGRFSYLGYLYSILGEGRWVDVLKIGSLFSGIGGLELGLEVALGAETVWQCEINPTAQRVLRKNWPNAKLYRDIQYLDAEQQIELVDLICGGFPCQNISSANHDTRLFLNGDKSGLWGSFLKTIGRINPSYVVIENVAQHWERWVPDVRIALYRRGYTSLPVFLSASDVGAPHKRKRCFVMAYSHRKGESLCPIDAKMASPQEDARFSKNPWRDAFTGAVRLDDGISGRLDEVRAYGNAVVPQVAYQVGFVLKKWISCFNKEEGLMP